MSFLKISNLNKSFGAVDVLKDINFAIDQGEFLVLVGPSGCGKSTLLNAIAGIEQVTSGSIEIDGRNVTTLHPSKRDIAMVFQSYALYPNMTVSKNMSFGMEVRKIPKAEREQTVQEVASMLQITHLLARYPRQLSGGQRQRVAMGRALVRRPRLFLFDEPLSNLDAKLRVEMRFEIKSLHQRIATTAVYVTHDQVEAMTLASRIVVLKDGIVQQFGTSSDVYHKPANTFVADFMGSPAMTQLQGSLYQKDSGLVLTVGNGDHEISLPQQYSDHLAHYNNKKIIMGVRPEALGDQASFDARHRLAECGDCMISLMEPTGPDTFAVTSIGGIRAVARFRADTSVDVNQAVALKINLDKVVFFDPSTEQRIDTPINITLV